MARGVNKVILVGNLGKDPEVRYMPSGGAVANTTLATSESWKDKQSGETQERTEWHNLTFYGKVAEIAGEYLKKGSQIYVEGSIRTEKWQDKEGKDRFTTKIIVSEMQMLGSRSGAGAPSGESSRESSRSSPPSDTQSSPARSSAGSSAKSDQFDDDIPF